MEWVLLFYLIYISTYWKTEIYHTRKKTGMENSIMLFMVKLGKHRLWWLRTALPHPPFISYMWKKPFVPVSPSDFMFRTEFCGSAVHSSHGNIGWFFKNSDFVCASRRAETFQEAWSCYFQSCHEDDCVLRNSLVFKVHEMCSLQAGWPYQTIGCTTRNY